MPTPATDTLPLVTPWGSERPLPAFGVSAHRPPDEARAVWGARAIDGGTTFDLLHDRQDNVGSEADRKALHAILSDGALSEVRAAFRGAKDRGLLAGNSANVAVLYDDRGVTVIASCQRSYGYVYLTAWLGGGSASVALYPRAVAPLDKAPSDRTLLVLNMVGEGTSCDALANMPGANHCAKLGYLTVDTGRNRVTLTPLGRRALATPRTVKPSKPAKSAGRGFYW